MKYFKFELIENDAQWAKNDAEYSKAFESIKSLLAKDFLEIYLAEYGFHDREINKMIMTDPSTLTVELLKRDKSFIRLEYKGVSDLKFSSINEIRKERQIGNLLEWGYDEFSKNGERLTHSVLTSCGLEFELSFESISAIYADIELEVEGTAIYL